MSEKLSLQDFYNIYSYVKDGVKKKYNITFSGCWTVYPIYLILNDIFIQENSVCIFETKETNYPDAEYGSRDSGDFYIECMELNSSEDIEIINNKIKESYKTAREKLGEKLFEKLENLIEYFLIKYSVRKEELPNGYNPELNTKIVTQYKKLEKLTKLYRDGIPYKETGNISTNKEKK